MAAKHKMAVDYGNPLRNLVGNPGYRRAPSDKRILNELLNAMARLGNGCCWAPVAKVVDGKATEWELNLKQCPGRCGHVWMLPIADDNVARWLTNEINQRRVRRAP